MINSINCFVKDHGFPYYELVFLILKDSHKIIHVSIPHNKLLFGMIKDAQKRNRSRAEKKLVSWLPITWWLTEKISPAYIYLFIFFSFQNLTYLSFLYIVVLSFLCSCVRDINYPRESYKEKFSPSCLLTYFVCIIYVPITLHYHGILPTEESCVYSGNIVARNFQRYKLILCL